MEEETENRTVLLPKTKRGKPKKLNYSSLDARNGIGLYFRYDGHITIGNYTTQQTYYATYFEQIQLKNFQELSVWIDTFIAQTTEEDILEIKEFANRKRKRVPLKEGDFFAYKVDRRHYGFGRILCDVRKLRKDPDFLKQNKHEGLQNLMAQPLVIAIYHKISTSKTIDIDLLTPLKTFPPQYIMDNCLFYGAYEIIGHLPLTDTEIDFPISYSKTIRNKNPDTVYLQYGEIYKETTLQQYSNYLKVIETEGRVIGNPYRKDGVGLGLDISKPILEACITADSNTPFWEAGTFWDYKYNLMSPKSATVKTALFEFFGLHPELSYMENLKLYRDHTEG